MSKTFFHKVPLSLRTPVLTNWKQIIFEIEIRIVQLHCSKVKSLKKREILKLRFTVIMNRMM